MPHIDIKCFPINLSDEQKLALAADISDIIVHHLNTKEDSITVALNEVPEEQWKTVVWDSEIGPHLEILIKKPGYSME